MDFIKQKHGLGIANAANGTYTCYNMLGPKAGRPNRDANDALLTLLKALIHATMCRTHVLEPACAENIDFYCVLDL